MTAQQISDRKTMMVEEAGRQLGVCRNAAYEAARRGESRRSRSVGGFSYRSQPSTPCSGSKGRSHNLMAHKLMRPAPLAKVAGPGLMLSPMERNTGFTTPRLHLQEPVDTVALLAARSGVAAATVRACFDAWRIEVRT